MRTITFFSLLAMTLSAAACDTTTTGAEGKIAFTPDQCGVFAGCDFGNPIGTGGVLLAHISGIDGYSTIGIDLESSDPSILAVSPTGDVGGRPTWQLVGVSEGPVSILAVDANGEAVDFIEVDVVQPEELTLEKVLGDAVGPVDDVPGYDQHWLVNANERTSFYVHAMLADQTPVMGQYSYGATIDAGLIDAISDPDLLSLGRLDFTATTPGQYDVQFDNDLGPSILVLIDVQDTL